MLHISCIYLILYISLVKVNSFSPKCSYHMPIRDLNRQFLARIIAAPETCDLLCLIIFSAWNVLFLLYKSFKKLVRKFIWRWTNSKVIGVRCWNFSLLVRPVALKAFVFVDINFQRHIFNFRWSSLYKISTPDGDNSADLE